MKHYVLFDPEGLHQRLLPLTFTRPVALLRTGMFTIIEKWERSLPGLWEAMSSDEAVRMAFGCPEIKDDTVMVAGNVLPTAAVAEAVNALSEGESLMAGERLIARCGSGEKVVAFEGDVTAIDLVTDIFGGNARAIEADFEVMTRGRKSEPLSATCTLIGDASRLFIEPGARVEAAVINVTTGPVYVGRGAEIAEGSCVRGPLALMESSHINMGTKVYPGSTIGPHCKVGGELNNVVFQGYSNKAHDGFLGNAVIGEWCNLGAGCVASNLKNDYSQVRLWDYADHTFRRTGLQFCGLIMGDHSKAGINTMFNTATVVGVGCNIHGAGFPRTFIESFSEGGAAGFKRVPLKKFFDIAERAMARRGRELTDGERRMFEALYSQH